MSSPGFNLGELATEFGGFNFEAGPPPPWSSNEGLAALFDAAGFHDPHVVEEVASFRWSGVDAWWRTQMSHGARAYYEFLSDDRREEFHEAALRRYVEVTGSVGPSSFEQRARIGMARAEVKS